MGLNLCSNIKTGQIMISKVQLFLNGVQEYESALFISFNRFKQVPGLEYILCVHQFNTVWEFYFMVSSYVWEVQENYMKF